jgi:hydroxyethylthiazole kinase
MVFKMEICEKVSKLINQVREKNPLVHHITNYVTVNDCANITLAIGGSPVMADDINEAAEMTSIVSALVINIGTLNARTIESMMASGKKANELGIPVVLDPVGIGATSFRTKVTEDLIKEIKFSVIRGNMSEIKMLAGVEAKIKGVDSASSEEGGEEIALNLSRRLNCIVAITGARDVISDGRRICTIENGHSMLSKVTGTGCMTTSLIGSFCGANSDYYLGAIAGITAMALAGEKSFEALEVKTYLGDFKASIFNVIASLTEEDILKGGKLHER